MTREEAKKILEEAGTMNPGRWISHSYVVARIMETFAIIFKSDQEKAYVNGLLHDIGRRYGITGIRHGIDGYQYLIELGEEEHARYCLTHSFLSKDIDSSLGKNDMTIEENKFVQNYLNQVEYSQMDRFVQLADSLGLWNGVTILERRQIDVYIRYGVNEKTVENLKILYQLQCEIEEKIGASMYTLFPEVKENIDQKKINEILAV